MENAAVKIIPILLQKLKQLKAVLADSTYFEQEFI